MTVTVLCVEADLSVFETPGTALTAARAQRTRSQARMALHTGENLALVQRRCQRLCEVANEGQTLVSAQCAAELQDVDLHDLGLHRLRDLAAAMRVFSVDSDAQPRSLNTIEHNLPIQATTFVGRKAEAEAIRRLLVTEALVTLTGPGGGGKTRLAAQIAAAEALRWPDGVWWVELAALSGDVAETVATATGVLVDPGVGALRSLTSALSERKALVCLDNCEHVLDSAASVVAALTRDCPEVTVLTTSQEPLGLANETVWRVPPLAGDEAMTLFLERAATVHPGITMANDVVQTICQRLDGIPLALELAAAWLRTLTPEQIETGLADRFGLLVRGPRGRPPRQQTLLASVDWSHGLLNPEDQVVLRRLAVFAGTFTLAAAQAVTDRDVLLPLARLVDKSLVVAEESRYRLLETIRHYALNRLTKSTPTPTEPPTSTSTEAPVVASAEAPTPTSTEASIAAPTEALIATAPIPAPAAKVPIAVPAPAVEAPAPAAGAEAPTATTTTPTATTTTPIAAAAAAPIAAVSSAGGPIAAAPATEAAASAAGAGPTAGADANTGAEEAVTSARPTADADPPAAVNGGANPAVAAEVAANTSPAAGAGPAAGADATIAPAAAPVTAPAAGATDPAAGAAGPVTSPAASAAARGPADAPAPDAGEAEVTRDRHLAYYLKLATEAEPELDRDRDAWRAIVEPELDNIRAALDHGLAETPLRRPPCTTLNTERITPPAKFQIPDPNPCERAIRTEKWEQGRELAASVAWLWNLRARGREGMAYLRRALDLAPDDRSLTQVRLLVGIAEVADTTSPYENFAQQALDITTDPRWRARCLGLLALEKMIIDFDAAAALCIEAEKDGDDHTRDSSQVLRGLILHLRDRHPESLTLLETAAKGLAERAERGIAATAYGCMSMTALHTGDLANAREWALRAVDLAEPMGDYHRVGVARSQLAFVHATAGEMDAAWAVITPVVKVAEQAFVPGLARTVGELHYREERFDQALAWFQRDLPLTESCITAINGPSLGKALRALGRTDEAAEVLDRTLDLARKGRMPRIIADTLEQQAHLTGSVDLHHEALAIRVEHGLRAYFPDSLNALAVLQGKPELTAGDAMSLDEAVAYARRSRGSRGRPTSGWDSLTPTEREVVRLAVEGLNNPEIGARLFMSRGTVKTHLSHVYAKLGVSNRTELATLAAAHPR